MSDLTSIFKEADALRAYFMERGWTIHMEDNGRAVIDPFAAIIEAGRSSDPEPVPLDVPTLTQAYANIEGAGAWTANRREPSAWVERRVKDILTEYDRLAGAVPALQDTPSGAIGALHEKGITGSRLDDIRARAKAGQPMKSWSYYVGNGMMDAYQPFVEEAQEDRLTLLAAVEELLAERAALQATGEPPPGTIRGVPAQEWFDG